MKGMKISPSYQYCLRQNFNTMAWVYGFSIGVPLLFVLIVILTGNWDPSPEGSFNGTVEFATAIAIFVQMCVEFRSSMRFGIQNGRSRKTIIVNEILILVTVAAIYSLINLIVGLVSMQIPQGYIRYTYVYRSNLVGPAMFALAQFLFTFTAMMSLGAFGMFLSAMYWRLDKFWRIVVSVGVPGLLVFGLPMLIVSGNAGYMVGIRIVGFFAWCMGLPMIGSIDAGGISLWRPVVFFLVLAVIWSVSVFPMMRKAIIKK